MIRSIGSAVLTFLLVEAIATGAIAQPAAKKPVSLGLPTATINASYCMFPMAKELGYFDAEGLAVDINNVNGSVALAQTVMAGRVDVGAVTPEPTLQLITKGNDLIIVYNLVRSPTGGVIAALPDTKQKTFADFRGKKLGAQSLAAGDIPFTNSIFKSIGIDAKADVNYLAVGVGAQALQALKSGFVDGLVLWDSAYAQIESLGVELKYFQGPNIDNLFSTQLVSTPKYVDQSPDAIRGIGRAIAKATLFASVNPEACVRMLWKSVPGARSSAIAEDVQLKNDVRILEQRLKLMIRPAVEQHGFGYIDKADVVAWDNYAFENKIIDKKLPDVNKVFTNKFLAAYNDFDRNAVIQQARNWKP